MEAYVLTRDDVEFLKQAMTNLRNTSVNPIQLSPDTLSYDQATSTYLVLTPSDGIGMATAGTAPNSLATPTGVVCQVVQQNNVLQPPQLAVVPGFTVTVWNYDLQNAVAGNSIVPVIQNAYGEWVPCSALNGSSVSTGAYIALTPPGGIPAGFYPSEGTGTGTGTGSGTGTGTGCEGHAEHFTTGQAVCSIFRIIDTPRGDLRPVGFNETVYNISTSAIAGCSLIIIWQDAYGYWLTMGLTGSSGSTVYPAGTTVEFEDNSTLQMDLGSILVWAGPVWDITQNTTGTISSGKTLTISGGTLSLNSSVVISGSSGGSFTLCGPQYACTYPLTISASINNLALPLTAYRIKINVTGGSGLSLTGMVPTSTNTPQHVQLYVPLTSANGVAIPNQNAGSSTANQFVNPAGLDLFIAPGNTLDLDYDPGLNSGSGGWAPTNGTSAAATHVSAGTVSCNTSQQQWLGAGTKSVDSLGINSAFATSYFGESLQIFGITLSKGTIVIDCELGSELSFVDLAADPTSTYSTALSTYNLPGAPYFATDTVQSGVTKGTFWQLQGDPANGHSDDSTGYYFVVGSTWSSGTPPQMAYAILDTSYAFHRGQSFTTALGDTVLGGITVANGGAAIRSGTVITSIGTTSYTVTFSSSMPSTNYAISLGPDFLTAVVGWSSKTTTGFTLNLSVGVSGNVDWTAVTFQ